MELHAKLRNLLVMAAADGSLTEREIAFLSDRRTRWGVPEDVFADAIRYAISDVAELEIPDSYEERVEMLQDLLRMMAADGNLAEVEKQLFAAASVAMNISGDELEEIIDSVLSE
ncbi:MAG TPA: TerB family tellurite resistance protein [Pirellulaceae bacterium]|nr:TerB family tellurite resistance protein [Pirellulaceae bacterium]